MKYESRQQRLTHGSHLEWSLAEKTGKKWIKPGNGEPLLVSCYCGYLGLSGHCSRAWHSGCKASCKTSCVWWRKWRVCAGVQEVWSIIARDGPTRKRRQKLLRWEGAEHTKAESASPYFSCSSCWPWNTSGPELLDSWSTCSLLCPAPPHHPTKKKKTTVECLWHWLIIFPVLTMNPGYCAGWESIPSPSPRVILMDAVKSYAHYLRKYGTFIGCCKC